MSFEFATATRVVFGSGTLRDAGSSARRFGRRALVVTGRDPGRSARLISLLRDSGVEVAPFAVSGEPELRTVQAGITAARNERCDLVVAFGGGSAIDAGKAIAAMLANDGELLDYLEVIGGGKGLTKPSVPFIAIPTTAGTGAEVTRNAVLASPDHRVKVSLRSPFMLPAVALVDPELTLDLPPAMTAATGLDALTQLIEPFVCLRAHPMTDALCRDGIPRVARSLRRAFQDGRDAAAREDMALASLFGGMALANAGLGAVHGLAGPIGGMFPAPHGALCAALLPHVTEANLNALRLRQPGASALSRYEEVARMITGDARANAGELVRWLRALVSDLGIPRLAAWGIVGSDAAEIAEKATRASSMRANPIGLSVEELQEIVAAAL